MVGQEEEGGPVLFLFLVLVLCLSVMSFPPFLVRATTCKFLLILMELLTLPFFREDRDYHPKPPSSLSLVARALSDKTYPIDKRRL